MAIAPKPWHVRVTPPPPPIAPPLPLPGFFYRWSFLNVVCAAVLNFTHYLFRERRLPSLDHKRRLSSIFDLYIAPIVIVLLSRALLLLDHVFFPAHRRQPIVSPMVIVAPERSGTTFLHRLLCRHPAATSMTLLHCRLQPSLCARYIGRILMRLDRAYFRGQLRQRLLLDRFQVVDAFAHLHEMKPDEYDEDMVAMAMYAFCGGAKVAGSKSSLSLYHNSMYSDDDAIMTDADRATMAAHYRGLVRRQLYWAQTYEGAPENVFYVAKTPHYAGALRYILTVFPDARLIHIVRDPVQRIYSTANLFVNVRLAFGEAESTARQIVADALVKDHQLWTEHNVLYRLAEIQRREGWARALAHTNAVQIEILLYEDLDQRPGHLVRELLQQLGSPVPVSGSDYAATLDAADAAQTRRGPSKPYDMSAFNGLGLLSPEEIRAQLPLVATREARERLVTVRAGTERSNTRR
jgi:hypothetical protein